VALTASEWQVSPVSDRRGLRLDGRPIAGGGQADEGSHGMIPGVVQLTPEGLPLILLVDAGTTGGYPVVALVIAADLGLVGQAGPGTGLRFQVTEVAAARRALAEQRATFDAARRRLVAAWRDR
jgi:allophanate hydrolase subunit 2